MNKRAFSKFEVKSINDEQMIIEGIATTPSADRMQDIVEPKGASFSLPIPLLWQHDHSKVIGNVIEATITDAGIKIRAQLKNIPEPGVLKDRITEAWQSIKYGLVRGLSIGFRPIEYSRINDTGGLRFTKWDWFELSAVTVPANAEASIQTIKSIDAEYRASSGRSVVRLDKPAGDSATTTVVKQVSTKENDMNIREQIAAFEAKRVAAADRMTAIMQKSAEEARTLDEAETEEYDTLNNDIKAIDDHLVRLKGMEATLVSKATPVTPAAGTNAAQAAQVRAGHITVRSNVAKGTAFTRYAMALCAAKGNLVVASEMAKKWGDSTPEVATVLKAAVAAGSTTDATWAQPLVEYQTLTSEFVELLRPQTIVGRIANLRRVPFNVRMPTQSTGGSYGWVGQGAPKPVTKLGFGEVTLDFSKAAGIIVLTEELVRLSNPSAEALVQADMIAGIAQFLDEQFIDPSVAAVSNVSPASITNGVTPVTASGTTAAHLKADVTDLFNGFLANNLTPTGGVWIMSNTTALTLSMMTNALGQPEFPGITMMGGTFMGLPVITSESVAGDSGGANIILAHAPDILLADDGQVMLDASREASLQMVDNPSAGAQSLVSLWQNNLVGLRAERYINWKKRRTGAVGYIADANYVA